MPEILPDFDEKIPQFDGAHDDYANETKINDNKKPCCFKCSKCDFKDDTHNKLMEHFHLKHLSSKTKTILAKKLKNFVKIPQLDGADDDNDNEKKSDQDR